MKRSVLRARLSRRVAVLGIAALLLAGFSGCTRSLSQHEGDRKIPSLFVGQASAQELYEMFQCPCCGKPIDTGCCGSAKERKDYVDALLQAGLSGDDVVAKYVEKYGIGSFRDPQKQEQFRSILAATAPQDRPIVFLEPSSKDLGAVSQKEGTASTFFALKNDGNRDLVINKLETSCGCTTASIIFEGEEGPRFGMPGHGINEQVAGWQVVIPPGGEAELKVYYDPNVHRDLRGAAMREIYVFSNDPIDAQKKVRIELTQVD